MRNGLMTIADKPYIMYNYCNNIKIGYYNSFWGKQMWTYLIAPPTKTKFSEF